MSEPRTRRIRTFLAINFPVAVVRKVVDEAAKLEKEIAKEGWSVAWVPAANVHLTLKFFGMVDEPVIEAVRGRLGRGLSSLLPFDLEARGLGAFPNGDQPKVLWAGVAQSAPLLALQKNVETWMEEIGLPRDERAYRPHLTVGRVREPDGKTPITPLLAAREGMSFGVGKASEVVVYESRTKQSGAEYVALARVSIGSK